VFRTQKKERKKRACIFDVLQMLAIDHPLKEFVERLDCPVIGKAHEQFVGLEKNSSKILRC